MDDAAPPRPRSLVRRLLRGGGAVVALLLTAEAVRVFGLTNKHTVVRDKVYRTAQLSPAELTAFIQEKGVRTVINLRGTSPDTDWYMGEARVTHAREICQEDVSLSAKRLPAPAEIRRLIEVFDHAEYPVVMHCQRGADRTGLASTVALLLQTDASLDRARRQLWPRYGHVRAGRTAVIDRFFDFYEAWLAAGGLTHTPARFRQWAQTEYCPGPYRAGLELLGPQAPEATRGVGFSLAVRATNRAIEPWELRTGGTGGAQLSYQLYDAAGTKVYVGRVGRVEAVVRPGESIDFTAGFPPVKAPGKYLVHVDLVDTQPIDILDADFVQYGSEPLVFHVTVR